ncbi:MAG TPA: M17 family metallopeptidase [Gaiellaceae bacterium]|nr:M17 family metallopeptidase [Gaiellaceae bacterium]
MRVETREAADGDVRARLDPSLGAAEVRRDGAELRVGAPDLPGHDGLRAAAAHAARALRREGGTIAWSATTADDVRAIVEGTAYGAYDPGLYKERYDDRPELTLALEAPAELHELARRQEVVVRHLDATRNLANRPPNDLTPEVLAEHARSLAGGHLTVEAYGRDWIRDRGMGGLAAVAAGSAREPQLIVMRHEPPGARDDVTLGLVGKAVTFDSGGISLKKALRMQDMKGDMSGGAAVIEGTAAIAELGLPLRVLTVVASTENVQGNAAYRPGDILRISNGKTIEIINTDAEGRLILADALHYARSNGATHIADFATLTGAMVRALGDLYAGWFCNDETFAGAVDRASARSGDLAWRFPLHPRYRRYIDSDFADMKNASDLGEGSAILAAELLREFAGDGPWAHFDVAPAYIERRRPDYALDQGGTGYGVRLIVELAEELS